MYAYMYIVCTCTLYCIQKGWSSSTYSVYYVTKQEMTQMGEKEQRELAGGEHSCSVLPHCLVTPGEARGRDSGK